MLWVVLLWVVGSYLVGWALARALVRLTGGEDASMARVLFVLSPLGLPVVWLAVFAGCEVGVAAWSRANEGVVGRLLDRLGLGGER